MGVTAPRPVKYTLMLPLCARAAITGTTPPPPLPLPFPVVAGGGGPVASFWICGHSKYAAAAAAIASTSQTRRFHSARGGFLTGFGATGGAFSSEVGA